jgi:hypothetical protein
MASHAGAVTLVGHHDHHHIHYAPDSSNSYEIAENSELAETPAYSSDLDRTSGEIPGFGMGLFALVPYALFLMAIFTRVGTLVLKARATYGVSLPLPHPPPRT